MSQHSPLIQKVDNSHAITASAQAIAEARAYVAARSRPWYKSRILMRLPLAAIALGAVLLLAETLSGGSLSDTVGVIITNSGGWTSPSDALRHCDAMASHPHDPGRRAMGIPDDQLIPEPTIEACTAAVRSYPDNARAWFELGRAQLGARRYKEAFAAFNDAAQRSYDPAKKYIGDAFLEGWGLPASERQDAFTAMHWYKQACGRTCDPSAGNVGFPDAEKALRETDDYLTRHTFDPSIFLVPQFMKALYTDDFRGLNMTAFLPYVAGFAEELGGDKILYVDSNCKPLSTISTDFVTTANAFLGILQNDSSSIVTGMVNLITYPDKGARDAVALVNRYKCDSPIARRIMENIVVKTNSPSEILGAIGLPKNKR
jgi:hypothetical protein